jgi:hypothetical protein
VVLYEFERRLAEKDLEIARLLGEVTFLRAEIARLAEGLAQANAHAAESNKHGLTAAGLTPAAYKRTLIPAA